MGPTQILSRQAFKGRVLVLGGLDPAEHNQVFITEDLIDWRAFIPEGRF